MLILKLQCASEQPEWLVITQITDMESTVLRWRFGICTSNKFLSEVATFDLELHFENHYGFLEISW